MGLFDWLFSKRSTVRFEAARVFITEGAKWKAFVSLVRDRCGAGSPILVLAYFPATLRVAAQKLAEAEFSSETVDRPLRPDDVPRVLPMPFMQQALLVPLPALLGDDQPSDRPLRPTSVSPTIIIPEVHPLRDAERRLHAFAETIPMEVRIESLASLDEPLIARFSGPWVQDILRKLGMKEDEEITSPLLSRQIRAAQDRILARVTSFEPADSAEEWMQRNVPEVI
jgi:hypothetical protein